MNSARREKRSLRVVAAPASDRLAVLLVEGNRDDALAARRWLAEQAGLETRLVADSAAATRELAQRPWDLLAIDLALPGALEFQRRMRSRNRWTATLAVTANQDAGFIQSVVEARVDGLLFKPVAKPRFVAQVLDIAAQARERRRRQQKRVLAIGAHPDDVELGCGGALAKHRGQGDVMTILTLSRGANGGDTNVRTREAHSAANLLGATLEFGELSDSRISEGVETIELIEAAIRSFRPTHVYTHSAQDTHQDHRSVHAASLVAARDVPNVFCYQSPSSTVDFRPNFFVDISACIDQKMQAIAAYESQIARRSTLHGELVTSTARYWGRFAGYGLAEPMIVVRQRDSWWG